MLLCFRLPAHTALPALRSAQLPHGCGVRDLMLHSDPCQCCPASRGEGRRERETKGGGSQRPRILGLFTSPPPSGVQNLYERVERMGKLEPLFVDITWGAGGSTTDLTLELRYASHCPPSKLSVEPAA